MQIDSTWYLPFPPAKVYAAWVSNDTVIPPATRMDIKAEVGGHYRLAAAGDDFTATNEGEFLEVEKDKRLLYSWHWQGDEETTQVEAQFNPHPEGTELRLRHGTFTTKESLVNHDNGWNSYVAGLRDLLLEATANT